MKSKILIFVLVTMSLVNQARVSAQFEVQHADLQITLPEKPVSQTHHLEDGTKQYRLKVDRPNGSIIVWHQDANPKKIKVDDALDAGKETILKIAGGKILSESKKQVAGKPARTFTVDIPTNGGEFRVGYYFANEKYYQVMSVGMTDFTRSEAVNDMFKSVKFVDKIDKEKKSKAR